MQERVRSPHEVHGPSKVPRGVAKMTRVRESASSKPCPSSYVKSRAEECYASTYALHTYYYLECSAETLEYIRGACEISTLFRRPPLSLPVPSQPCFTYILSLYFYDASGGFPLPLSLHLSLSSWDYVSLSVLCMTWSGRTDGRTMRVISARPPACTPAHVVSRLFGLAAQKEGRPTNEETDGRTDGRTASVSNGSLQSA